MTANNQSFPAPYPIEVDEKAYELLRQEHSHEWNYEPNYVEVFGHKMHYIDVGEGDPIVFLHGQPDWIYEWRNVLPYVEPYGRVIGIDNIGFGKSDQPEMEYNFEVWYKYLEATIEKLGLKNITLVIHDWGSVLGANYASLHPENVQGLVLQEALILPEYPVDNPETFQKTHPVSYWVYTTFKNPKSKAMVIDQNTFIERVMCQLVLNKPTQATMDYFREPFKDPSKRYILQPWPQQVPLNNDVPYVRDRMLAINKYLLETDIPKLLTYCRPGVVTVMSDVEYLANNLKNIETLYLGPGTHFSMMEDHPELLGRAIADWYRRHLSKDGKAHFVVR